MPALAQGHGGNDIVGALAEQIADYLSHESATTSEANYIAPGAIEDAAAARAMEAINGAA